MATNDLLAELQKDTFKVKYEDLWRFRHQFQDGLMH